VDRIDPLALARDLIRRPSVTPADAGALDVLQAALEGLGFRCWRLPFEQAGTPTIDNLYARFGDRGSNFCFAGHTDVVPVGDEAAWTVDPFAAVVDQGWLIGRGAADMKAAIACFAAAADQFLQARGDGFDGSISFLITGDEEGPAGNGTVKALQWMAANKQRIDACLVGEPTATKQVGDMAKIGRRGSVTGRLTVLGAQGHIAYPHLADNPVRRLVPSLDALQRRKLDDGTADFQPSNLEVTTIDIGNRATNVIPAKAQATFNIRYNNLHTGGQLESWMRQVCAEHAGAHEITFEHGAEPFLTQRGALSRAIVAAVEAETGIAPDLSTTGGTSDARFIKNYCPVVELGMIGQTMHKVDEKVRVDDIAVLTGIYRRVLERWFA
jgi:succinyl-diaminopimelate desuccinylase